MTVKQYAKKIISIFLVFCLVVGSMLVASPQEAYAGQSNLIANGGFDTATDWYNTSGNTEVAMPLQQEAEDVEVTEHFPNGNFENASYDYSISWWSESGLTWAVESEQNGNKMLHIQDFAQGKCVNVGVDLKAETAYTIQFKMKASTTGIRYHLFGINTDGWDALFTFNATSTEWETYTYEYTTTEAYTQLIFQNSDNTNGNLYIDNFSVTTEGPKMSVTEHIPNGDFENTEYNYEDIWWSQSSLPFAVETEEGRGRVLHVQDFNGKKCMDVKIPLKAGTTYTVSLDVKSATTSWVSYHLYDAGWQKLLKDWESIPGTWTTYTYTYTPTTDQTGFVFQSCEGGAGDFYIDNFSVKTEAKALSYTEGIGSCLGAEPDNVLVMKQMTEATYKNVSITAGKQYRYSYKVKTDQVASVAFSVGTQDIQTNAATSEWTPLSGTFTADADATEIRFERIGEGNLFIDDVEVYEVVGPAATEVMTTLSKAWLGLEEGATAYTMHLGVSNYAELIAEFGEWSWFEGEILIDGTPTKLRFNLGSNLFATFKSIPSNVTSVVIPAGTEFKDEDGSSTKLLVTESELEISNSKPGEKKLPTTLSENSFSTTDEAWRLVLNVSDYDNLIGEFGIWSWLEGEILVDGVKTTVRFSLGEENTPLTCMYHEQNQTAIIPLSATSIVIPKGTEFKDVDNSSNALLVTENEFSLSIKKPEPDVYNDIKISFDSINGEAGFYFKAEIVDGPDKGKVIGTEAYGEWMSPSFGAASYSVDGEMAEIDISYSPINDKIYISGFPELSTLDGITLKKGTIIRPVGTAQNVTPMRIVNTVEMVQDKVYGRWGYKGQIQTPTEFYDVVVSVKKLGPYAATLVVEFADGSKKPLNEIYGKNAMLSGATELVDSEQGTYTNKGTQYLVQPDGTMLLCVDFAMPDSVEVKAGTILWPSVNSEVQKPVRILNRIYLNRNAEDEWVVRVGAVGDEPVIGDTSAGGNADSNSPQTGDRTPIIVYASIFVGAIATVSASVYLQKKRRQQV